MENFVVANQVEEGEVQQDMPVFSEQAFITSIATLEKWYAYKQDELKERSFNTIDGNTVMDELTVISGRFALLKEIDEAQSVGELQEVFSTYVDPTQMAQFFEIQNYPDYLERLEVMPAEALLYEKHLLRRTALELMVKEITALEQRHYARQVSEVLAEVR